MVKFKRSRRSNAHTGGVQVEVGRISEEARRKKCHAWKYLFKFPVCRQMQHRAKLVEFFSWDLVHSYKSLLIQPVNNEYFHQTQHKTVPPGYRKSDVVSQSAHKYNDQSRLSTSRWDQTTFLLIWCKQSHRLQEPKPFGVKNPGDPSPPNPEEGRDTSPRSRGDKLKRGKGKKKKLSSGKSFSPGKK